MLLTFNFLAEETEADWPPSEGPPDYISHLDYLSPAFSKYQSFLHVVCCLHVVNSPAGLSRRVKKVFSRGPLSKLLSEAKWNS